MRSLIIIFIFLSFPEISVAGIDTFECKVTNMQEISNKGEIITGHKDQKNQIGSTFTVEKKTGQIRGGYFINNRVDPEIKVINEPTDNTYYVISISHGPHKYVGYLSIGSHLKNIEVPFIYTSSGTYIYTGYCI